MFSQRSADVNGFVYEVITAEQVHHGRKLLSVNQTPPPMEWEPGTHGVHLTGGEWRHERLFLTFVTFNLHVYRLLAFTSGLQLQLVRKHLEP